MSEEIYRYVRKHTQLVTSVIVAAFIMLAAGEYYLYRQQMHLNQMLSEGLIQLKHELRVTGKMMQGEAMNIMMREGKVIMKNNKGETMLKEEMMMSDGTKVMEDGTVMKKDGNKMMLQEGESMYIEGTVLQ